MPLNPQAQDFVDMIAWQKAPGWHERPVLESRELFSSMTEVFGQGPELASVSNEIIQTVPVRIYRPTVSGRQPVVIYFHGGGWVLGNLDTHDALCRRICKHSGATIMAVDYRLAPEHKYPAALEDCWTVTKHMAEHAADFDLDCDRLVVAGDSAGGNLAAAVALRARDEGGPRIRAQVLIYPVIEPDFETGSYRACATGYGLTRETMQWFWEQYVGGTTADRKYVALANAEVSQLPPAHVITAEYDVLRDEGERYAARLESSGVVTRLQRYDGVLHGFVHFAGVFDDGVTAAADLGQVLQRLL